MERKGDSLKRSAAIKEKKKKCLTGIKKRRRISLKGVKRMRNINKRIEENNGMEKEVF